MARSAASPAPAAPVEAAAAPLRVLLIDDGAHRVSLIHDELIQFLLQSSINNPRPSDD